MKKDFDLKKRSSQFYFLGFLCFLLFLPSCSLEKGFNYQTQEQVEVEDLYFPADVISYMDETLLLNLESFKKFFDHTTIKSVGIYSLYEPKVIREIEVINNIIPHIQLFPGNTAVIVSDGESNVGFMTRVQKENPFIMVDQYSTLAAELFKNLVIKCNGNYNPAGPLGTIDPVRLYFHMKEIRSFRNINYEDYLDYIFLNGLPYNLEDYFFIQLSAPAASLKSELIWDKYLEDDFIKYEVFRYDPLKLDSTLLVDEITDAELNVYKESVYENNCYYYFVSVITEEGEITTNRLALARYPSGWTIRLVRDEILTARFKELNEPFHRVPEYFIKVNMDGSDENGVDPKLLICGWLSINDFIRNDTHGIYSWQEDDPSYGLLFLSPCVIELLGQISFSLSVGHNMDLSILKGYISPYSNKEDDLYHHFGTGFDIKVKDLGHWVSIAEYAEMNKVSYIEPMYKTFDPENKDHQAIHLDWRGLPEIEHNEFEFNPVSFGDGYTIEYSTDPLIGKVVLVKDKGRVIEKADYNKFGIKVSKNPRLCYFRISSHRKVKGHTDYVQEEEFHRYQCAQCKQYIEESHSWILKVDPEAPPGEGSSKKNAFFDEQSHWENECEYCGFKKGIAPHNIKDDAVFQMDLDAHWKSCEDCEIQFNRELHSYSDWQPVDNHRVHERKCTVCSQAQVRPHCDLSSWTPFRADPAKGHGKYCGVCGGAELVAPNSLILEHRPSSQISYDHDTHWHYCIDCGYRMNEHAHIINKWTDLRNGFHTFRCEICGFTSVEEHTFDDHWSSYPEDPLAGHVRYCTKCQGPDPFEFDYYEHVPGDEWFFNDDKNVGWRYCRICNAVIDYHVHREGNWDHDEENHWIICAEKGEAIHKAPHKFDNWINNPDEFNHRSLCGECNYIKTEDHTWGELIPYPEDPGQGHALYCTKCDEHQNLEGADHNGVVPHNYGSEYLFNDQGHWQVCADCGYIGELEGHIMDGEDSTRCSVCNYINE